MFAMQTHLGCLMLSSHNYSSLAKSQQEVCIFSTFGTLGRLLREDRANDFKNSPKLTVLRYQIKLFRQETSHSRDLWADIWANCLRVIVTSKRTASYVPFVENLNEIQ